MGINDLFGLKSNNAEFEMDFMRNIGIGLLIAGIVIMIIFVVVHYLIRRNDKSKRFAQQDKKEGVWEFTKRNLPLMCIAMGFVIALTGFIMIINP